MMLRVCAARAFMPRVPVSRARVERASERAQRFGSRTQATRWRKHIGFSTERIREARCAWDGGEMQVEVRRAFH